MPPAAIVGIGAYLGYSGALTVVGGTIATAIGVGTVSSATATAIGAAAFSGSVAAIQGGSVSDVLKSAVIGGVTSYAGSSIANSVSNSVSSALTAPGAEVSAISSAMGKVAGAAVAGAIGSGTAALLYDKDPLEALLKGGLSAAMSSAVGLGIDAALQDVPGFGDPSSPQQAAFQRATKAAIGTAILSGGDKEKINTSVMNSLIGSVMNTATPNLRTNQAYEVQRQRSIYSETVEDYKENIDRQNKFVNIHNEVLQDIENDRSNLNAMIKKYDDTAWAFNNFEQHMRSQGYERVNDGSYDSDGFFVPSEMYRKSRYVESRPYTYIDDYGNPQIGDLGPGLIYDGEAINPNVEKQKLYDQAKAIDAETVKAAWAYDEKLGLTKSKLEGLKHQLEIAKEDAKPLEEKLVLVQQNLENSLVKFQEDEAYNAAIVQKTLNDYTTVATKFEEVMGYKPSDEDLEGFTKRLGNESKAPDILSALPTLDLMGKIADTYERVVGESPTSDFMKQHLSGLERNPVALQEEVADLERLEQFVPKYEKFYGVELTQDELENFAQDSYAVQVAKKNIDRTETADLVFHKRTGEHLPEWRAREYVNVRDENFSEVINEDIKKFKDYSKVSQKFSETMGYEPTRDDLSPFEASKQGYLSALPKLEAVEDVAEVYERITGAAPTPEQKRAYWGSGDVEFNKIQLQKVEQLIPKYKEFYGEELTDAQINEYVLNPYNADLELDNIERAETADYLYHKATGQHLTKDELLEYANIRAEDFHNALNEDIGEYNSSTVVPGPAPGSNTQVFDDGSTITTDQNGDVVDTTESTDETTVPPPGSNTQVFDDGSTLTTDENGDVTDVTDATEDTTAPPPGSNTQVFDDGSTLTTDENGDVIDVTDATEDTTAPPPGSNTQVFDDGSTLTTDDDGNITDVTDATEDTNDSVTNYDDWDSSVDDDVDWSGWEWDPETGTYTRVFDDGSSITVDEDGNVVNVAEATDSLYYPDIKSRRRTTTGATRTNFRVPIQVDGGGGGGPSIPGLIPGLVGAGLAGAGMSSGTPETNAAASSYKPLISPLEITDEKSPEYWMGGTGRLGKFIDPMSSGLRASGIDPIPDVVRSDDKNRNQDLVQRTSLLAGDTQREDEDEEGNPMDYYSYGNPTEPGDVLRPFSQYARGGSVMPSPLMVAAGGVPHKGSHYVQGAGGGQDDLIDAKLADGEYVFDADIVAALGDGSNKRGAEILDQFREQIRKHKRSAPPGKIPPAAKSPLAYLKEVKK